MIRRQVQKEVHLGYPVLREQEFTELARIPVTGDRLEQSIILHPRYVPRGTEHEIMTARVFHRGRTVDLFLDEPIEVNGEECGILNFKGVGADADREMVIHPTKWYYFFNGGGDYRWVPRTEGDSYGRVWGALTEGKAEFEYSSPVLEQLGIKHVPSLAINVVPPKVERYICRVEKGKENHPLSQIVRPQKTNIRARENELYNGENDCYVLPQELADIDAAVIKAQLELARQGKMLRFVGHLRENRFIDGTFTDKENYYIDELKVQDAASLVQEVVNDTSLSQILPPETRQAYIEELDQKTGLPFKRLLDMFLQESVFRIMHQELEKVVSPRVEA